MYPLAVSLMQPNRRRYGSTDKSESLHQMRWELPAAEGANAEEDTRIVPERLGDRQGAYAAQRYSPIL